MPSFIRAHRRILTVAGSVLLLHALVLWGVQSGLLQRPALLAEAVVMRASVLAEAPARPAAAPQPARAAPVTPHATSAAPAPSPAPAPAPAPVSAVAPGPAAKAPATALAAAPAATAMPDAGAAGAAAPTAPATPSAAGQTVGAAAQGRVELPSSEADCQYKPEAEYPRLSRRHNEQGRVLISVLFGTDGTAQKTEVKVSSGFDRLDQAALSTVKLWRCVPGKRGGVSEARWYNVPVSFVLE